MSLSFVEQNPAGTRTLVLVHGYGADERDLLPLGALIDPGFRTVSLRAPHALGQGGRAWFPLDQAPDGALTYSEEDAAQALGLLTTAVERLGAGKPVVVLGFSQGAALALALTLTRPELVAATLAFSGVHPAVPAERRAPPAALAGRPVFAAHGEQDPLISLADGRKIRDELVQLGLAVEFREYPMGHGVIPEELDDARAFLRQRGLLP